MARAREGIRTTVVRWMAAGAAVLLVACADESGGLEALPTAPSSSSVSVERPTTTVASTVAPTTTDDGLGPEATDPPGITTLGEGPWRRVDGAPGIDTPGLFYELMPQLWAYLPVVEDIDQGILWTLGDRDVEIIEAYLQARLTYYRAVTQDPIDLEDEGWEYWYANDADEPYMIFLSERRSLGIHTDMDLGVLLLPEVVGDERTDTTAIVFECVQDGSVALEADGSLAAGSFRGILEKGMAYRMELIDQVWRIVGVFTADMACAD